MEEIWDKETTATANYAVDQLQEDEDEEALSLSDLPLIPKKDNEEELESPDLPREEAQIQAEEFDFCSFSKQSEMCTADEVFFQGQILPLRHSVSSDKGSSLSLHPHPTRPVSRSQSMDRYYSGGFISSRSSSIGSHQSSSSGSSVSNPSHKFKPRFNQFHSLPSPSPRIRFPGKKPGPNSIPKTHRNNPTKKSSVWNIFRLGLLTPPPEMAFQDLKSRCPSNISGSANSRNNFGSRNSSSSHGSSITSSKRKARTLLAGGCRCSSDAVATVPTRVVTIKRSASEGETEALRRRRQMEPERSSAGTAKQWAHHHHRTFEWIKQLSLQGAPDEDDDDEA